MEIISNGANVSMLSKGVLVILLGFLMQRHTWMTECSISCLILGQKKHSLARATILSPPKCPISSCRCLYVIDFSDSGTTSCVLVAVSLPRMPSPSIRRRGHFLRSSRTGSVSVTLSLCFRWVCVFFQGQNSAYDRVCVLGSSHVFCSKSLNWL